VKKYMCSKWTIKVKKRFVYNHLTFYVRERVVKMEKEHRHSFFVKELNKYLDSKTNTSPLPSKSKETK